MNRPAFLYRFGSAEFDEARFALRVAGLPVDVERRALEVLAYLLRHAGEVVTKDELLREVWAGRITVDKVLPNAINKLRRALGEANAAQVSTQARIGYRLDGTVTRTAVGRVAASPLALAAGQAVPGRDHFLLQAPLGRSHSGGEVWLAVHGKTHEQRVYKFALDGDRLRSLKREATLLRVLQESPGDTRHFVQVLDWNFEQTPYFLECRYGGLALDAWAGHHLAALDTAARIALFLQIADAVATAHAVGVLHKDLKPANVLVEGDAGQPHTRLTDFGSGHLLEPDRLAQLGITRMGMTVQEGGASSSSGGTPLYIAPELYEGQAPTLRSDVYSLGILLYQLLTGRIGQPMAPGWEAQIEDPLLREDLCAATDGAPERRLGSAAELADRLRRLEPRRAEQSRRQQLEEAAQHDHAALARSQARRPFVLALIVALTCGVGSALWLLQRAEQAREQARFEADRATALAHFLNVDLIGRANPLVWAKGADANLRELLLAAREGIDERFAAQPGTAAAIHHSLASMFAAADLYPEAEAEALRGLELAGRAGSALPAAEFEARALLVRVFGRRGKLDLAQSQLQELERLVAQAPTPQTAARLSGARAALHMARAETAQAVAPLRAAIAGLQAGCAGKASECDAMRVDLIQILALAGRDKESREEGRLLIEEARARREDSALLIALAQLALSRAQGEDHAAAEQLLLAAQPVLIARLGENHSRHIHLLGERLAVAFRQADWPRTITLAQAVHERASAKFGPEHASSYVTLLNWARTLDEAGQAQAALPKAQEAHAQLLRLAGAASPRTQDAAFVLALILLELGDARRAQPLVDGLDAAVLESGRATGQWPAALDALRGMAMQLRGDAQARPKLEAALTALKEEEDLVQPSRLYLAAASARARLR